MAQKSILLILDRGRKRDERRESKEERDRGRGIKRVKGRKGYDGSEKERGDRRPCNFYTF
jgi:hypothetical protein